jgi:hypothetical protein
MVREMRGGTAMFGQPAAESVAAFTPDELALLDQVDSALDSSRSLKEWWRQKNVTGNYAARFELSRAFNPPSTSFGFFDTAYPGNSSYPVMGSVEEMVFDTVRKERAPALRDQLREYVLRYFMRVSDYRQPEATVEPNTPSATVSQSPLSWCPQPSASWAGFGYSQHFYKLRGSGSIGRFSEDRRFASVDLREVRAKYEWIVLKVRIFDFNLNFAPFGADRVQLTVPMREESYLVLSPDFIVSDDHPSATELGRYGFGYAFLKNPGGGLLAYGPGMFELAFELITFRVLASGEARVEMVFVANRPEKILNVSPDPLAWSRQVADFFSMGMFSQVVGQTTSQNGWVPPGPLNGVDPLTAYVSFANLLTGGLAAKNLCVSKEQLEKDMLVRHFTQHYQLIAGSLLTWSQVPDWLDPSSIPSWAHTGRAA